MHRYEDRVYFMLPYGHCQTLYYSWSEALMMASKLAPSCKDSLGDVYIDAYFQSDYLLPPDKRPYTRFRVDYQTIRGLFRYY